MDNIEASDVSISVDNNSNSSDVVTRSDHTKVSSLEFDGISNLSSGDIQLNGIRDRDLWVGESDGTTIMGDNIRDLVGANSLLDDLAELVLGFFSLDASKNESSLNIIQNSVEFSSLLNGDDIHKSSRESRVSSDFAIDSNVSFLIIDDQSDFSSSQGVFKTVFQNDGEGKGFSVFMGTLGRFCGEDTTKFVKHPTLGSCDSL